MLNLTKTYQYLQGAAKAQLNPEACTSLMRFDLTHIKHFQVIFGGRSGACCVSKSASWWRYKQNVIGVTHVEKGPTRVENAEKKTSVSETS